MSAPDPFPPAIRQYLRAFARRRRAIRLVRAAGRAAAAWLGWVALTCAADRFAHFPPAARWACLIAGAVAAAAIVAVDGLRCTLATDWNDEAARAESAAGAGRLFGERLRTVTSQWAGPSGHRGSGAMLARTAAEVESLLPRAPVTALVPWRCALPPWLAAIGLAAILTLLAAAVPSLKVPQLLARALRPAAPIDPVTAVRLTVEPGNTAVSPGGTALVAASIAASPATDATLRGGAELFLSVDGRTWSRAAMRPLSAGPSPTRFEFAVPAIDRDLQYYVRAGDARSDTYAIHVKRIPAVREFRVRYAYPDYANHPPVTVTNTDGALDCLGGSTATVTLEATEPLSAATWVLDNERLSMTQVPGNRREWQVQLPMVTDGNCAVELISASGERGAGPSPMPLKAEPDEPPRATVVQPAVDVRLNPADALLVRVAAADDYGIAALDAKVSLNGAPVSTVQIPLAPRARPLRREGEFTVDLATIGAAVGDVLTVTVDAVDSSSQPGRSEERRVLIAPRSVLPRAYERGAELRRSAQLARDWRDALGKAKAALDAARGTDPHRAKPEVWQQAGKAFAVAADAEASLRQSLLRALARADSPELTTALLAFIDVAAGQAIEPGRVLSPAARNDDALSNRLIAITARVQEMARRLGPIEQGERADVALAELANLKALTALPKADGAQTVARDAAIEQFHRLLEQWTRDGLPAATSAGAEGALRQRVDAGRAMLAGLKPPDLTAAAQEWAARLTKPTGGGAEFPARLAAAAEAEAVRADGDAAWARDLYLASRAAAALAQLPAGSRGRPAESLVWFRAAFEQLAARRGDVASADAGRDRLREWAGASPATSQTAIAQRAPVPEEELALEASAAVARGDYTAASALDARLADAVERWSPEQATRFREGASRSAAQLKQIDQLIADQASAREAATGPDADIAAAATAQAQVAQAIAALRQPGDASPSSPSSSSGGGGDEMPMEPDPEAAPPGVAPTPPKPPEALASRRPSLAATWNARAAADALARAADESDPNRVEALRDEAAARQAEAGEWLVRARARAAHREALRRLAEAPSLAPLFQPAPGATPADAAPSPLWAHIGPRSDWLRDAASAGKEPAGDGPAAAYRDRVKAYFDSLAKSQQQQGKK